MHRNTTVYFPSGIAGARANSKTYHQAHERNVISPQPDSANGAAEPGTGGKSLSQPVPNPARSAIRRQVSNEEPQPAQPYRSPHSLKINRRYAASARLRASVFYTAPHHAVTAVYTERFRFRLARTLCQKSAQMVHPGKEASQHDKAAWRHCGHGSKYAY